MRNFSKAATLMEVIMAVVLLNIIIMGAATFGYVASNFLQSSTRNAVLINEQGTIIEHIHKRVLRAAGDPENPAITAAGGTLTIRFNDGSANPVDPAYSGPGFITGTYTFAGSNLTYADTAGVNTVLSTRLFNVAFSVPQDSQVKIDALSLRFDPANPVADVKTNPELYLPSPMVLSSYSQTASQ